MALLQALLPALSLPENLLPLTVWAQEDSGFYNNRPHPLEFPLSEQGPLPNHAALAHRSLAPPDLPYLFLLRQQLRASFFPKVERGEWRLSKWANKSGAFCKPS